MATKIDDLKNLILAQKIDDAITFLKEHSKQFRAEFYGELPRTKHNSFAHSILFWLADISADFYLFRVVTVNTLIEKENDHKQVLWELWIMEHPEFNSYIQWLPKETLSDTTELLPLHRLIDLLVEYGADLNVQDRHRNILFQAVYRDNELMIRLLIEHGADINVRDKSMRTPLQMAITLGRKSIVKLLCEASAAKNTAEQALSSTQANANHSSTSSDSSNLSIRSYSNSKSNLRISSNLYSIHNPLNSGHQSPGANSSQDEEAQPENKSGPGSPR